MKFRVILATAAVLSISWISSAQGVPQTGAQKYIDELMATEPLRSAQLGVMAAKVSGEVIASYESHKKLVPASNTKLITTGVAMHELGADFKFDTSLAYSGTIEDGTLHGDLYIVGGGDPTLASKDSIALKTETLFAQWRSQLSQAGISRIEGNIVGDGRYFDGDRELASWLYEDIGTYYGTGADGLCFYRNIQEFRVSAGPSVGAPVKVAPSYPELPWMRFEYNCSTGIKGSGDKLYLYATDVAPVAEMRGTFAVDRGPKRLECSNKFGAYTCAWMFRENLVGNGISVDGSAADIDALGRIRTSPGSQSETSRAAAVKDLKTIGSTSSPSLRRISFITNQRSDNFYAEAMLRILGRRKKGSADYAKCVVAENEALREMGLDIDAGASLVDGSGLSRKNLVSPEFFCSFLKAMLDSPSCEPFVNSLPQPGQGTQAARMQGEPSAARIRYKSGSMEGVRCYSGYVIPSDGGKEDIIVFSVMVNNYTGPSWKILSQIDRLIALVAREN